MSYRAHRTHARRAAVTSELAALEHEQDMRRLRERDEAEDAHNARPCQATRERLGNLGYFD